MNDQPFGRLRAGTATRLSRITRRLAFPAAMAAALVLASPNAMAETFSGTFDLSGDGNNVTSFEYNGDAITDLTVSALTKVGITSTSSQNNFRGNNWPLGATGGSDDFEGSVDLGKYIEFTLTAASGKVINLPSVSFGLGRSATGPRQWQWRSSADGFANPIPVTTVHANLDHDAGVLTNPDLNSNWTGNVVQTSGAAYEGLASITFRLYGYNAEQSGGTGGLQGNLTFGGTLEDEGDPVPAPPTLAATTVSDIGLTQADVASSVVSEGSAAVTERGFVYAIDAENPSPEIGGDDVTDVAVGDGPGAFSTTISGLASGTTYAVRSYAVNDEGTAYGSIQTFTTLAPPPTITGIGAANGYPLQDFSTFVSADMLPAGWTVDADGTAANKLDYSQWSTSTATGIKGGASVLGYQHTGTTGVATFTLTLLNDTGGVINELFVSYLGKVARTTVGRSPEFTVKVDGDEVDALGYSTTREVDEIRYTLVQGLAIADGASFSVTWESERGDGSGSSKQIGITNVQVYVPEVGEAWLPVVTSPTVSEVTANSATLFAEELFDGADVGLARGFVLSESALNPNPEIDDEDVILVPDVGFDSTMIGGASGLTPGTTYVVRAYSENSAGVGYSTAISFTTLMPPPVLVTEYQQAFNDFDGSLPSGWTAFSSGGVDGYGGAWGTGTAGGFRGGVSDPGVLGYQHTDSTGTLTVTLTLQNGTGGVIDRLYVSYLGRAERTDQGRSPEWKVEVDGSEVAELAYSTEGGADAYRSFLVTGLNIADGGVFTITWESERGEPSGGSKQIGIADVLVALDAPPTVNFADWIADFEVGELTGFADNPAGDGIPSGLKHVFGLNPEESYPDSVFLATEAEDGSLTIVHPLTKGAIADDVEWFYQWTLDLENWFAAGEQDPESGVEVTFSAPAIIDGSDPDFNLVQTTATVTGGETSRLFVRVGTEQESPPAE